MKNPAFSKKFARVIKCLNRLGLSATYKEDPVNPTIAINDQIQIAWLLKEQQYILLAPFLEKRFHYLKKDNQPHIVARQVRKILQELGEWDKLLLV